jgi:starch phosphorylase
MKASIAGLCHTYNSHRMVREYTDRFYLTAAARYQQLTLDGAERAKALADWRARLYAAWHRVRVNGVEAGPGDQLQVGQNMRVRARVSLGDLRPDDVAVQFYTGRVDAAGSIVDAEAIPMLPLGPEGDEYIFEVGSVPCRQSGLHGYTVRVLPQHPDLVTPFLSGLIVWAAPEA